MLALDSDSEEEKKYGRKYGKKNLRDQADQEEEDTEDYWFVCRRSVF